MKRKIDIHNYEEFFIDYLDGNLSDEEIVALEDFLLENPDLRRELEGLENTLIKPEKISYSEKDNLKQIDINLPVNPDNFDFFCIAENEGDLTEEQTKALHNYLDDNPEKTRDYQLFRSAYLNKEEDSVYIDKSKLKKSIFLVYRREIMSAAAIAAGIALLLSFWAIFINNDPEINNLAFYEETKKETSVSDTTSRKNKNERIENIDKEEKDIEIDIPEKTRKAVKNAATTITIKTSIPIASIEPATEAEIEVVQDEFRVEDILAQTSIDAGILSRVSPVSTISNDPIKISSRVAVKKPKPAPDPDEYLTLQEFAVQKLTDLIFKEEEKDFNAVNIASAGVQKINSLAGTNMKLEASAAEGSDKKVLRFNSGLISFSTPINRED